MKHSDLVSKFAADTGLTKVKAAQALNSLVQTITTAIASGDDVTVQGLCKISVVTRKAREVRNPRTGTKINISSKKVPSIKPLKALKDAVK